MELIIDLDSPVPVYEQLRAQVTELAESGELPPDYPLPSVRQLAAELGVAPGTVARAYRELQSTGVVASSRALGTRVAEPRVLPVAERRARLAESVDRMVASTRRLGASDQEVEAALARALRSMA